MEEFIFITRIIQAVAEIHVRTTSLLFKVNMFVDGPMNPLVATVSPAFQRMLRVSDLSSRSGGNLNQRTPDTQGDS